MQIDAMVSEADVGGIEEGQSVTSPWMPSAAEVSRLGETGPLRPTTNQNVVNYTTVVEVNNADLKLRPA